MLVLYHLARLNHIFKFRVWQALITSICVVSIIVFSDIIIPLKIFSIVTLCANLALLDTYKDYKKLEKNTIEKNY